MTPIHGVPDQACDPSHAAAVELLSATRELMLAAAVSDAPAPEMRAAAARLRALAGELGGIARRRVRRVPLDDAAAERMRSGEPWQVFAFNPMGVPLVMRVDGEKVSAELTPNAMLEGPPDWLHGGFGAALMDALLGTLVRVRCGPAYTATLEVRYAAPTLLDVPMRLEGHLAGRQRRKVHAAGRIVQDGKCTLEAFGLFVRPADRVPRRDVSALR